MAHALVVSTLLVMVAVAALLPEGECAGIKPLLKRCTQKVKCGVQKVQSGVRNTAAGVGLAAGVAMGVGSVTAHIAGNVVRKTTKKIIGGG